MLARFGRWTSSFRRVSFLLSFDCQGTQIERLNHSGGRFTSRLRSDNSGGTRFLRRNCQVRWLLKIRHALPDRSTGALWPVILVWSSLVSTTVYADRLRLRGRLCHGFHGRLDYWDWSDGQGLAHRKNRFPIILHTLQKLNCLHQGSLLQILRRKLRAAGKLSTSLNG